MSEVESQLALALGSEGTPSIGDREEEDDVGAAGWEYKGEQVDEERLREMQERIDGCVLFSPLRVRLPRPLVPTTPPCHSLELRTTHLATLSLIHI